MINAILFVEGIADVKFLQDFVRFHYEIDLKAGTHIIECGGNTELAAKKTAV
jgi:predicted ATP-dependent endonuclease of OLD family